MQIFRPPGIRAGFGAIAPEPEVPELRQLDEHWPDDDYQMDWHAHQSHEVFLQLEGTTTWQSETETHRLRPGTAYVAAPGARHRLRTMIGDPIHFVFAKIDFDVAGARYPKLAAELESMVGFLTASASRAEGPFRKLVHEVKRAGPHRELAIRLALDALLVEIVRALEEETLRVIAGRPAVEEACRLMRDRPQDRWTHELLAKRLGLSPGHFATVFAGETGRTPRQFLIDVRVERAKTLLRDSDAPITEIAIELGFASSQHFARTFKERVGVTASDWRRGVRPQEHA